MPRDYRPRGFRAVTPGLSVEGSAPLLDFLVRAFDAREGMITRNQDGSIAHGEIVVGDSVVEMSEARPQWPAKPCSLHLYVPDTDGQYARALAAGATSLQPPEDAPYGDRAAAVRDPAGNQWFVATRQSGSPVPKGFHSVTPYVITRGADAMIEFMARTFGATVHARVPDPNGKVTHAEVQIDDSMIEVSDGSPAWKPMPCCLHVYVPDADEVYRRALSAGATSLYAPMDQPYGDREGGVQDSGGNYWFIATARGTAQPAADPAPSSRHQPA
jgi:PhnB protein